MQLSGQTPDKFAARHIDMIGRAARHSDGMAYTMD